MMNASSIEYRSEDETNNVSDSQTDTVSINEKWIEYTKTIQNILFVKLDSGMVELLKKADRHGQEIAIQCQSE